jgi:putative chitinase
MQVTKIINGGTNGLEDRRARFGLAKGTGVRLIWD